MHVQRTAELPAATGDPDVTPPPRCAPDPLCDNDPICMHCDAALTVEVELINSTCLACMFLDEREAKIAATDEIVRACRHALHLGQSIAAELSFPLVNEWEATLEQMRTALAYGHYL